METLLIEDEALRESTPMHKLIPTIREAFQSYADGDSVMPAKTYIDLPQYNGDFRSMPAYVNARSWEGSGVKWVNVHPENKEYPTVMATAIYTEPETGFPLAILDGTELTGRRTGAVAGLATDYLAIKDATTLGMIGAGAQSYLQVEAISTVRDIEEIYVVDKNQSVLERFKEAHENEFDVFESTVSEAANCDVLSTITPSRDPIVELDDVGEYTHINAMGADAQGKQELSAEILKTSKVVIDDWEQASHSGEINVPLHNKEITDANIHSTLGEVVSSKKAGRDNADGVTVFDSTGLAIQDVATSYLAYEGLKDDSDIPSFRLV